MNSAKIRISSELNTPSESRDFEGELFIDDFASSGAEFNVTSPCRWDVVVTNTGSGVLFISGSATCELQSECVRCLEPTTFKIDGTVEGYCKLKDSAKLPEDIGDDECVVMAEDRTIDIGDIIKGAILLEIPMSVVCSEDCSGLTQYCDSFEKSDEKSPFAILENFDFSSSDS